MRTKLTLAGLLAISLGLGGLANLSLGQGSGGSGAGSSGSGSSGAGGSSSGSSSGSLDSGSSDASGRDSSTGPSRTPAGISEDGSPSTTGRGDRSTGLSRDDDSGNSRSERSRGSARLNDDSSDSSDRESAGSRSNADRAGRSDARDRERAGRGADGDSSDDETMDDDSDERDSESFDSTRRSGSNRSSSQRGSRTSDDESDDESDTESGDGSSDRRLDNRGRSRKSGASNRTGNRSDLGISLSRSDSEDLTVESIGDDSAAARAGLRDGDEIVSVNGREISSRSEFDRWVRDLDPGASLQLSVRRDGRQRSFSLELDEAAGGQRADFNAGLSFSMDDEDRLVVSNLDRRSFWGQSGVRRGDVILSIDDRDVESRADFLRWVHQERGDEPLTLIVLRDGRRQTLQVDIEVNRDELSPQQQRSTLGVMLDQESENGALVSRVYRGSAADDAGLRRGDYIVRFDGERVRSPDHLIQLVGQHEPGSTVQIEFTRREQQAVNATLGASSTSQSGALSPTRLRRVNEDEDDDDEALDVGRDSRPRTRPSVND